MGALVELQALESGGRISTSRSGETDKVRFFGALFENGKKVS
jgi:hypothetical protein